MTLGWFIAIVILVFITLIAGVLIGWVWAYTAAVQAGYIKVSDRTYSVDLVRGSRKNTDDPVERLRRAIASGTLDSELYRASRRNEQRLGR